MVTSGIKMFLPTAEYELLGSELVGLSDPVRSVSIMIGGYKKKLATTGFKISPITII